VFGQNFQDVKPAKLTGCNVVAKLKFCALILELSMTYLRTGLFVISIALFGFTGSNGEKSAPVKPNAGTSGAAREQAVPTGKPVERGAKVKEMSPDDF
jgi:hypothetical protein